MKKIFVRSLINPDSIEKNIRIGIEHNRIVSIEKGREEEGLPGYAYALPGFIDIHTHGGGGYDIMEGSLKSYRGLAKYYLSAGTTSFISSLDTASLAEIDRILTVGEEYLAENKRKSNAGRAAALLGCHLEGPWLSGKNAGAMEKRYFRPPDRESFDLIQKHASIIRMATFSCHFPQSGAFIKFLLDRHIVPACGHDEATDEEALAAFKNGLSHITHLYCATSSFQRREGFKHLGTLEMALLTPGISVEVIADDRHITKHFWDFIRHNKGIDDIMLVSDSMCAAGLKLSGKLEGKDVIVERGVAWTLDKSVFAGSISSMHGMFRILVREWGVNLCDAVRMTSFNQALKFGLNKELGSLEKGKIADLVLLDKDLNIARIIKSGIEAQV